MRIEILVIREFDSFSSILIERGFSVVNFPTIAIEPVDDFSELDEVLTEIEIYDGVFITSPNAAEPFLKRLKDKGISFGGKFYVLGHRTDRLLKTLDCRRFFDDRIANASELIRAIPQDELKGGKFLFPRGDLSLRVIPDALENIAEVREIIVYKSTPVQAPEKLIGEIERKLKEAKIIAVCFFSPSGIDGFVEAFTNFSQNDTKVAAIGQTTARRARERQLRVDFISSKPTAKSYAVELTNYLKNYLRKEI